MDWEKTIHCNRDKEEIVMTYLTRDAQAIAHHLLTDAQLAPKQ